MGKTSHLRSSHGSEHKHPDSSTVLQGLTRQTAPRSLGPPFAKWSSLLEVIRDRVKSKNPSGWTEEQATCMKEAAQFAILAPEGYQSVFGPDAPSHRTDLKGELSSLQTIADAMSETEKQWKKIAPDESSYLALSRGVKERLQSDVDQAFRGLPPSDPPKWPSDVERLPSKIGPVSSSPTEDLSVISDDLSRLLNDHPSLFGPTEPIESGSASNINDGTGRGASGQTSSHVAKSTDGSDSTLKALANLGRTDSPKGTSPISSPTQDSTRSLETLVFSNKRETPPTIIRGAAGPGDSTASRHILVTRRSDTSTIPTDAITTQTASPSLTTMNEPTAPSITPPVAQVVPTDEASSNETTAVGSTVRGATSGTHLTGSPTGTNSGTNPKIGRRLTATALPIPGDAFERAYEHFKGFASKAGFVMPQGEFEAASLARKREASFFAYGDNNLKFETRIWAERKTVIENGKERQVDMVTGQHMLFDDEGLLGSLQITADNRGGYTGAISRVDREAKSISNGEEQCTPLTRIDFLNALPDFLKALDGTLEQFDISEEFPRSFGLTNAGHTLPGGLWNGGNLNLDDAIKGAAQWARRKDYAQGTRSSTSSTPRNRPAQ
ncbi:hypothetical protein M231_05375 [Tremella mesenterica]|uniref:Uncharacterized protein n=1 Tax=Tremella mesenterica TaxID=5217 RepID=A0A4Q1BIB6_TREME|nr:hypothetical protein M231_05375 [Tremella mesenterica]